MTTSDFPNTWYITCTCQDMKPHKKFVVNVVWLLFYSVAKIWIFDIRYMIQLVVSRKPLIFLERKLFGLVVSFTWCISKVVFNEDRVNG